MTPHRFSITLAATLVSITPILAHPVCGKTAPVDAPSLVNRLTSSALEFCSQVPVTIGTSLLARQITDYYHTQKGHFAIIQDANIALQNLHRDVLAALARPITQQQQADFAARLASIEQIIPNAGLIERYGIGFVLYLLIQGIMHQLEGQRIIAGAMAQKFSDKFSDELLHTFAEDVQETWEEALESVREEATALHRLIRDLPVA